MTRLVPRQGFHAPHLPRNQRNFLEAAATASIARPFLPLPWYSCRCYSIPIRTPDEVSCSLFSVRALRSLMSSTCSDSCASTEPCSPAAVAEHPRNIPSAMLYICSERGTRSL